MWHLHAKFQEAKKGILLMLLLYSPLFGDLAKEILFIVHTQ
jgi:hypothetical protein